MIALLVIMVVLAVNSLFMPGAREGPVSYTHLPPTMTNSCRTSFNTMMHPPFRICERGNKQ